MDHTTGTRRIVMIGPAMTAMGGIASVIATYKASGFLDRWSVAILTTFVEGSAWRRLVAGAAAYSRFLGMLLGGRVAFVHLHVAQRVSFLRKSVFALTARAFRRPVILHVHGAQFDRYYEDSNVLYRCYICWVLESCTWIVALSDQWLQWFESNIDNKQILRIHNPVIVEKRNTAPEKKAQHIPPMVLFLGRIGQRKGAFDLLHAIAQIIHANVPCHLYLCGDGEIERASQLAADLGIADHVTIPGWVDATERRRLLAESRVFVLPSYHEGLPVAILEAMSAGVPVVSSPIGGIPDAISDGLEGLLVKPGHPDQLASALIRLLVDESLAHDMGVAGQAKVSESFAADRALAPLDALYRRLLSQNGADSQLPL